MQCYVTADGRGRYQCELRLSRAPFASIAHPPRSYPFRGAFALTSSVRQFILVDFNVPRTNRSTVSSRLIA
ncbi:hypothetical protein RSOLAG1IB_08500 [Rhizoctonia solani AG-1 IB]|uniref:Uncharacterized protein n=1 Tax=Thanatephorus cucumeris (strain AG1-IB / isolate 7/3/14) TaxID=1108050 RepID=A0A0B7FQ84_THACB|nr:hypothetical protein RSOLAG1IB_08500 [Rhizoctonia solani AG-1 IB]